MANIIFADSDLSLCREVEKALIREGHVILIAHGAQEAYDTARFFKADLLIANWMLRPRVDGSQVAAAIATVRKNIMTILMTEQQDSGRPDESSIIATIAKPFTIEELIKTVRQTLDSEESSKTSNAVRQMLSSDVS